MRGDVEAAGGSLDEETEPALPLLDREEHSFAVRAEREHAVEPGRRHSARSERAERVLVESAALRRRSGVTEAASVPCERRLSVDIDLTLDSRRMEALRIERDDDVLGSRSPGPRRETRSTRR